MDITFVILWTDFLVFLLTIAAISFAVYSARFEHLRAPWREVLNNRVAMVSALILTAYISTGILDSIHFRQRAQDSDGTSQIDKEGQPVYEAEVLSLLDYLLTTLREQSEISYSSPFALRSHSKRNIILPDGKQVRDFAPLKFAGTHLKGGEGHLSDILSKGTYGGVVFMIIVALLTGMISVILKIQFKKHLYLFLFLMFFSFTVGALYNLSLNYHLFGTDKVGKDVFFRAIKGIRTGIVIGTLTTLVMLPFAVLLGIMAGYFKGKVDDLIQYIYTTLSSIPGVLLIASAVLMLQAYMDSNPEQFDTIVARADTRLFFLCVILGVSSWTGLCRILRGETLKLSQMEYVEASKALGTGPFSIIQRHILPNVMHIVLITVVLDFSGLVLAEAVLSYVGVGVDPSMESWGNMINAARLELARDPVVWWNLAASFILMVGLVLSANLFADGVRDAFDPRLRTK